MNKEKLIIKDLVNIGIFSVTYMVLSILIMIPAMLSPVIWLLWPAASGVLCTFVYVLLAAKSPKAGTSVLIALITGVLYFATGECTWTIVMTFALAGILAESIRKIAGYKSIKGIVLSSGALTLGFIGSPLPMWLFQESYMKSIIAMGMDKQYVHAMQKMISPASFIGMLITACAGGLIGGLIGKKLLKKHFEKAGIL